MKRETVLLAAANWFTKPDAYVRPGTEKFDRYRDLRVRMVRRDQKRAGEVIGNAVGKRRAEAKEKEKKRALEEIVNRLLLMRELVLTLRKAEVNDIISSVIMRTAWNAGYASAQYLRLFDGDKEQAIESEKLHQMLKETWAGTSDE